MSIKPPRHHPTHSKVGIVRTVSCSCGWTWAGEVSAKQVDRMWRDHYGYERNLLRRVRFAGPETSAKRSVEVPEPTPLHRMGRNSDSG